MNGIGLAAIVVVLAGAGSAPDAGSERDLSCLTFAVLDTAKALEACWELAGRVAERELAELPHIPDPQNSDEGRRRRLQCAASSYSRIRDELRKQVEVYCREHNIAIVVRTQAEELDPSNPHSVRETLRRDLVWHGLGVPNITDEILERLERSFFEDSAPEVRFRDSNGEVGEPTTTSGSRGQILAVLDMARLFNECRVFQKQIEEFKAEVEVEEGRLKRTVARFKSKLKALTPDSHEYNAIVKELRGLQEFGFGNEDFDARRKSLLKRESDIYLVVYGPMLKEVGAYCSAHDIAIVLQVRNKGIDLDNPLSVSEAIQEKVVWYGPDVVDITDEIIERVNARLSGK